MLQIPAEQFHTRPQIAVAVGMPDSALGAIFGNFGRRFLATGPSLTVKIALSAALQFKQDSKRDPWYYRLNPMFRTGLLDDPEAIGFLPVLGRADRSEDALRE